MNKNIKVEGGNYSFFLGALTLLFIYLKITKQIDWSWWWVLSPMWLPFGFVLAVLSLVLLIVYISDRSRTKW